jgi:hypothetical protein
MICMVRLKLFLAHRVTGHLVWLLFAVVFFYSGLYATEWLLAPDSFAGGWRWVLVAGFPLLLPMFFVVNRRFGCASGACRVPPAGDRNKSIPMIRMPGA